MNEGGCAKAGLVDTSSTQWQTNSHKRPKLCA